MKMLQGAMDELSVGDPWDFSTDVGPVIDATARDEIAAYVEKAADEGRLIHQLPAPGEGFFVGPALIRVDGIADLEREVFGPVLQSAPSPPRISTGPIDAINATGYGLTFGLHTRIDGRVQAVTDRIEAGNAYVNRNQIGAIVGSQPFGGEGLSGTGPKAGGPNYLPRFTRSAPPLESGSWSAPADLRRLRAAIARAPHGQAVGVVDMPGPTGESNRLRYVARAPLLCLGPGETAAREQAEAIARLGGNAVFADGSVGPDVLAALDGISGVVWWGDGDTGCAYAVALSRREGPIVPLIGGLPDLGHVVHERHLCVDTTAAGGNAQLLVETGN